MHGYTSPPALLVSHWEPPPSLLAGSQSLIALCVLFSARVYCRRPHDHSLWLQRALSDLLSPSTAEPHWNWISCLSSWYFRPHGGPHQGGRLEDTEGELSVQKLQLVLWLYFGNILFQFCSLSEWIPAWKLHGHLCECWRGNAFTFCKYKWLFISINHQPPHHPPC